MNRMLAGATTLLALATLPACGPADDGRAAVATPPAAPAPAPAGPTAGETEYAELTAAWSDALLESCGPGLEETLGTRDLVQGALDGVRDPAGRAHAELEDARHWLAQGDAQFAAVRPMLAAGTCDGTVQVALDEAVQAYVKAGTAAVQAGQIAGAP